MSQSLRSWRLFWLLATAVSVANCLALPHSDFRTASGRESIIQFSVRCALPFFLAAFTASSFVTLWPNRNTRWLMSNRRYFGLAFAFGMVWHLSFVGYSTFFFGNRLNATSLALDGIGLIFLLVMTLTSFRTVARHLSLANWRRVHKTGIYAIWLLATYIYLEAARGGDLTHKVLFVVLMLAWLLRFAAWLRARLLRHGAANERLADRTT